jgi:hypothetical protein
MMSKSSSTRNLALCSCALGFAAFAGSLSAGSEGLGENDGSDLSGPPQINLSYQAREPRLCKSLTTPPSQAQAAVLVQCTMDQDRATGLFLMQEVMVQIGTPRSYVVDTDGELQAIDTTAPVYPLAGSLKTYWCSPVGVGYPAGKNCTLMPIPQAIGKCWRTTFGDWKCNLIGPTPNQRTGMPGPTTY